jgi:hypothetical protein
MKLSADPNHDLNWSISNVPAETLWELDFQFSVLNDPALFSAHALAVETFAQKFPEASKVALYRGSLDILHKLMPAEDVVEAASFFGEYLHRLAAFLPERITPYCLFEDHGAFSAGRAAQLMSKDRFWHLALVLEELLSPVGILLPQDAYCTAPVLTQLDQWMVPRVIPELRLNEMWHGLEELIVVEEGISPQGRRMLKGFEAAGGKIRSRGI